MAVKEPLGLNEIFTLLLYRTLESFSLKHLWLCQFKWRSHHLLKYFLNENMRSSSLIGVDLEEPVSPRIALRINELTLLDCRLVGCQMDMPNSKTEKIKT